ncbi:uncharacterized protein F5891DRAFT_1193625 [Suillus fuscotomentosus]|uniref:Uncharacterized protein n=1 Tax=Suillus fuscotomentosus TaxID=1912939 RepID=A0AAD4HH36_9AGAM|nr:uncharacterized protein F5891DRAFT_1193625 [Suillus fuscotomentosus]KAG1895991.1 hypothetical protein F5891DRAFT_1193625 [Suillus fuscotomentosus]
MLTCSTEQDIIQVSRCHPPKEIYSNPGPTHIPPDQQRLIFMGELLLHPSLGTIDNYDELYPSQQWEDPSAVPPHPLALHPLPHISALHHSLALMNHDVPPPTIGPFPHVAIAPSTGAHYAPPGALGSPSQVAGTKRHFAASPAPLPAPPPPTVRNSHQTPDDPLSVHLILLPPALICSVWYFLPMADFILAEWFFLQFY